MAHGSGKSMEKRAVLELFFEKGTALFRLFCYPKIPWEWRTVEHW
ncbi:hypothetical protein PUV47_14940 [Pseudovibrio exalbescens]|nr:hypothetical protein [Pseudovibrio exalbescens]MDD7911223.1 hypothetical protein [Pseudovibrio exalbescens]